MRYRVTRIHSAMSSSVIDYTDDFGLFSVEVDPAHIFIGNNFNLNNEKLIHLDLDLRKSVSKESFQQTYDYGYKGTVAMRCLEPDIDCIPFFNSL